MSEEIKVRLIEFTDRKFYLMMYVDPMTGRKKWRSTKVERTGRKRERAAAERVAGNWEKELRDGTYQPPSKISWSDFRERYENEVLESLADETGRVVFTVFNTVERILAPNRLFDLTAERLSYLQSELRAGGRSEATIKTYLKHLRAALNWAGKIGLLQAVPKIELPKRAKDSKVMKGRPIKLEEFERMLDKVPAVVGPVAAPAWRFYLRGLWTSGLRLEESLELYWDQHGKLCIDLTSKRPVMRIPAALQKNNEDEVLPLAPEFARLLSIVPESQRTGRVFKLVDRAGSPREFGADWVGRQISAIGKKAAVKVDEKQRGDKLVVKYASAHDLRRAFGTRWALRVMPKVLKAMMRHESIETSEKYYVHIDAQTIADEIWTAFERVSNTSGNTTSNGQSSAKNKPAANSSHNGLSVIGATGFEPATS